MRLLVPVHVVGRCGSAVYVGAKWGLITRDPMVSVWCRDVGGEVMVSLRPTNYEPSTDHIGNIFNESYWAQLYDTSMVRYI